MGERLDDLARSFRLELRGTNRSERAATLYGMSVRFFGEWLVSQGRPATLEELTRSAIRAWLASLVESGKAPGTVRTRFKGLSRFCSYLVAEGDLTENPMSGLEVPAVVDKPVPILTDDELTKIIKACVGTRWYERRDEAVVRFLLNTGVRVAELVGMSTSDLDLDAEMAIVTGKGGKKRPVYFDARTSRALDRWLRERRKHRWAHLDNLFLGERGALTTDGVRELVRYRGDKAGISGLHPHRFRHTWAHDYLLAGGQERDLKRLAGWTSDSMLERYGSSAADLRAREGARRLKRGNRV